MQIIVCKLVVLLFGQNNKAPKPKQCLSATGTNKMLQHAGRIMKLTAVLLLGVCMQIYAAGYGQRITLSERDVPIEKVLKKIQQQTSYKFLYTSQLLQRVPKVTVVVKDATVEDVLDLVLKGQMLDYEVSEGTVVIKPRSAASVKEMTQANMPDPIEIRGVITDENGAPASGVNIAVKGTNKGTTTNLRGEFVLRDISENAVLLITSVGYDRQEILVKGNSNINTQLKVAVGNLDEMQVIAYGKTSKRLSTGNVSTVKARDIEMQPVNNPLLALQGRVPGLFITQSTGIPGGGIVVRIQGQNSLNRGNDPLYVIDGVPYISQLLPDLSGPVGGILGGNGNTNSFAQVGGGNPLSFLNPADIESIEILKDADATSIYGSRAAAGAILITTKKGTEGKTKVNFKFQKGFGKVTRFIDLMNTNQYLEMRFEGKKNDNAAILSTDYDINGHWDSTRNTDWQKVLMGGTAHITDASVSFSGGNSSTQFLIQPNYHRESTVFPGDFKDEKVSVQFSVNNKSVNQRLKIQLSGNYLIDDNKLLSQDLTTISVKLAPNAPSLTNPDGSLNWAQDATGTSTWYNPLAYLEGKFRKRINNLISNAQASFEIIHGLEIKSNFGYTSLQSTEIQTNPSVVNAPELRSSFPRQSFFANSNINTWIVEPQLTFSHTISQGSLNILLGSTFQRINSSMQQIDANGFSSDVVMEDISAASSLTVSQSIASKYNYNAFFGRVNYDWKKKYIINFSGRIDGSSRFGSKNQFHNFGSVGAAWIFSNEPFLKTVDNFISFGKLRASYGTTGNDQIGDYQFMNLYRTTSVPESYQGVTGSVPVGFPNPYLQWEETEKMQAGLDLGFLKDEILVAVNYYRNKSSNQLQGYSLPFFTGFGTVQTNLPATVLNSGWEFTFNSSAKIGRTLNWKVVINMTAPSSKLVSYPNLQNSSNSNLFVVGQPIPKTKVFRSNGVDNNTGLFNFFDVNGNVTSSVSSPKDLTVLGITAPKFYGGVENAFQYAGLEVSVLFQFIKQNGFNYKLGNFPGRFFSFNDGTVLANQPVSVMDRWRKSGDNTFFQKFSADYSVNTLLPYIYGTSSDIAFSDASFIRLKNASISWIIPQRVRRLMHLQNAKIFLLGQNLLTISKYVGFDPETQSTQNLPPLKIYTMGIQLGF